MSRIIMEDGLPTREVGLALLDTMSTPIVLTDNDHVIVYLNKAARARYNEKRGLPELVGTSLLACHNEESCRAIHEIHARFMAGEEEVPLEDTDEGERITVVAVRDGGGALLGYYERHEG